jgi:GNAT superfamily N-acetyltransferase
MLTDERTTSSNLDIVLADGSAVTIRDIRPTDAEPLREFHSTLSTRSITMRYLGPHPVLSDMEVERFTNVDNVDRVALVAERSGHIVAVARYERATGSDEAEVAFCVQDRLQGLGLGTILLRQLATVGISNGIRRLTADTFSDNRRMLGVFRDSGFAHRYARSSDVVQVVLDIAPTP